MSPLRSCLFLVTALAPLTAAAAEALDPADQAFRASSYAGAWAGPIGADHSWVNPASGHAGSIRATKERVDPSSRQPCREIEERVSAGAAPATGYAVGCRGSDGNWRIVQSGAAAGPAASTMVPADVTPYQAPADINAAGSAGNGITDLPPQVRILVPYKGAAGATPH